MGEGRPFHTTSSTTITSFHHRHPHFLLALAPALATTPPTSCATSFSSSSSASASVPAPPSPPPLPGHRHHDHHPSPTSKFVNDSGLEKLALPIVWSGMVPDFLIRWAMRWVSATATVVLVVEVCRGRWCRRTELGRADRGRVATRSHAAQLILPPSCSVFGNGLTVFSAPPPARSSRKPARLLNVKTGKRWQAKRRS